MKKIDNTDPYIVYEGEGWTYYSNFDSSIFLNGDCHDNANINSKLKFYFTGTLLKIYGQTYSGRSNKISVTVNGVLIGYYSMYGATSGKVVLYEHYFPNSGIKEVVLENLDTMSFTFDYMELDGDIVLPPVKSSLAIHRTLKSSLPSQVPMGMDEVHFTEDGRIYINDNHGRLVNCNTGKIEISNPLTMKPLEYGCFKMSNRQVDNFNIDDPIKFDAQVEGNIGISNNTIKLKGEKTYNLNLNLVIQTTRCDVQIKNLTANEFIGSKIICVPPTSTFLFSPLTSVSFNYTPVEDCEISVIITDSQNTAIVFDQYCSLTIQEIRNNPVAQYGGFETKVLFDGKANIIGEYELADSVDNYDFVIISADISTEVTQNYGQKSNIVAVQNIEFGKNQFMYERGAVDKPPYYVALFYGFKNEKTIYVNNVQNDVTQNITSIQISKIIGVKGQLPSLLCGGEF